VRSISHPQLIEAAHIRSKAHKGSDDWRNGLPFCSTHHAAFDAGLFGIDLETLRIVMAPGVSAASIGIGVSR
jgi:putative restriction endonuclease